MQICQLRLDASGKVVPGTQSGASGSSCGLALAFGPAQALEDGAVYETLRQIFPQAVLAGCTTGGEIHGRDALDGDVCVTGIGFEHTRVEAVSVKTQDYPGIRQAGEALGRQLAAADLAAVFVLSDGTQVNGSTLIAGLKEAAGLDAVITGGLAGDGARFQKTSVALNGPAETGRICAIGFCGDRLALTHGSCGGWDVFGPERRITRSASNLLFELDGQPALDLYKRYLGEEAEGLPGSALLFPLHVYRPGEEAHAVVRTVVGIDEAKQAMIFAGDVPEGWCARLMRGNFDHLVEGAAHAAEQANSSVGGPDRVAVLVSCIGRKLLLGQRASDEVEAVANVLGARTAVAGFYSYGEISPHAVSGLCELHNQTMTVTVFSER